MSGLVALTDVQEQVLRLAADAYADVAIAEKLGVGEDEVAQAIADAGRALGVDVPAGFDRRLLVVLAYVRRPGAGISG